MNRYPCPKCSGKQTIRAFSHVQGGVCFKCGGSGFVLQKAAPRKSKRFVLSFLWPNPSDVNYMGGDFCRCARVSARSRAEAERKAENLMRSNGSTAYRVEDEAQ